MRAFNPTPDHIIGRKASNNMSSFHKLAEEDFSEQMQELVEKIRLFNEVTYKIMNIYQAEEEIKQAEKAFMSLFHWLSDRGIMLIYDPKESTWKMPIEAYEYIKSNTGQK